MLVHYIYICTSRFAIGLNVDMDSTHTIGGS